VTHLQHAIIRPEWLASYTEAAIEPEQIIIDAHHHLYDRPGIRYLAEEYFADVSSGHRVAATVYVQGRSMLRADGPEHMRSVGETEFANGIAAMSDCGRYGGTRLCAGIVSSADLTMGAEVRGVLDAHIAAAGSSASQLGRLRGIRHITAWDPDQTLLNPAYRVSEDMMASEVFRAGFAELGKLKLRFDAWIFFHQLPRLAALARAFPHIAIALDHCGGIIGIGAYAGKQQETFRLWSAGLRELAKCPNVWVKIGGLGMKICGFGFEDLAQPPSSAFLARHWQPWIEVCVEIFGTRRCMFESNSPVDRGSYSYSVGWNAFKRIVSSASVAEKDDLFWKTAADFYNL
jgi:L-fuconolactonase